MNFSQEIIAGKQCNIFIRGNEGPVIYWGIAAGAESMAQKTVQALAELVEEDFILVAYEAKNWNRDFSPWPQEGVRKGEYFEGGAPGTLVWLRESAIPYIENRLLSKPSLRMTAGYSLAGLFSLWAYLKCGCFFGAASVSGSLWYPGWLDMLEESIAARKDLLPAGQHTEDSIYLSLGRKEEKTRNLRMAAVGDATRETERLLRENLFLKYLTLEWNPGGHFTDPERRMAKGMAWLIHHRMNN